MKKALALSIMVIFSLFAVGSALAKPAKCPQPRKTKSAPGSLAKKKIPGKADAKRCLLYTSPSPRDRTRSRMPSSA